MRTPLPSALDSRAEAPPGRRVSRPRLAARVTDALDSGSVIITAGAGFGKTTVLEQAVEHAGRPLAWVACREAERDPGALLMRIVAAVAEAEPGASDALAEQLAMGRDVKTATRELISELAALLVEPLILVIDDAEHLDGAERSLRLVGELLRAEIKKLHIAVASRRPLELRVAKLRAAGRLAELTAADLAFDAEECTALLRSRGGVDPAPDRVDSVMEATEGWPLGIALAAGLAGELSLAELSSAPDLNAYLSEELLDSLEPELRDYATESSVAGAVTREVAGALDLPEDFADRLERAGVPLRRLDDEGGFAHHPLLREFLLGRLRAEGDDAYRRAHAAVAPAVARSGDPIASIEHWLEAERWPEAVEAMERAGPTLLRTSPQLLESWISLLPRELQELPTIRTLEGQLVWRAGRHAEAVAPLREAVLGHRRAGDPEREWLARFFLTEALYSTGEFEEMLELAEGWDGPGAPKAHAAAAGVAWYKALALLALGRGEEAERLADRLRREPRAAERFPHLDSLVSITVELPAGDAEAALRRLSATIRELELRDQRGRMILSLMMIGLVHVDIGEVSEALEWFERCQRESERLGLGFVARGARLQRASLLAQRGEVEAARLELERAGQPESIGWRGVSRHAAEAFVASASGDGPAAVAAAERALETVQRGSIGYRVWAAMDMAIVLSENGSPEPAREAITDALSALDDYHPGQSGRYHRARLLATRAWLEYEAGDRETAYATLRDCWREAGDRAHLMARAHWSRLSPILWEALADGAIEPQDVLASLEDALPGGEALVAFTDHPRPAVRGSAIPAALASNHPAVLSRLAEFTKDSDERVASVALATVKRLQRRPPALRFDLLGRFRASRDGWEIADDDWGRPIDARLVRFLLVNLNRPVTEDLIFEALWPELSASSARRSLQVSVSRARRVLDPPGVERSVIQSHEHAYLLALGPRDAVDAEEFLAASGAALAQHGEQRRALLERARVLRGGEPLPEERYSDWATAYRERLDDRFISVLTSLIDLYHRAGDAARAADAARDLVDLDPLNEDGHRALMTSYARTGRRGQALRQYLECRRALTDELGIEPAEETARLQARILAGETV